MSKTVVKLFIVAAYIVLLLSLYVMLLRDMSNTIDRFQSYPDIEAKVAELKRSFDEKNNELASWAVTVFN